MTRSHTQRLELLRRQAALAPELPGVYLMRDEHQEVIYIGKAKDLRARVRTYFAPSGGDGRFQIEYLLQRVVSFETVVTQSEEQAFILERDLITKYRPRYNIRLKDDKSYISIRIDERSEWPRVELVRRTENDGATYFGPYASSGELRNILEVIKKVFPLRTCTDAVLHNRQRPCLEHQIKRCCAPCCLAVDPHEYRSFVKEAKQILEGKTTATIRQMTQRMEVASEGLRFEEAAAWRDRIELLEKFQAGHSLITFRGENRDVFGLAREGAQGTLCVLTVRSGRIIDSKTFELHDLHLSDEAVIEGALEQYYDGGREVPPEVLIPREFENQSIVAAGLSVKRGRTVELMYPQRGSKARLVSMAELNAKQAFLNSLTYESEWNQVSAGLARLVGLRQHPRRVECFDISNFQGSDTVGAMVVFFDGVADKSAYRRYTVSQQGKPNDFASMYEVVYRRLKRGMEEGDLADLMVIDGGEGQLSMALQARDELRLSVEIVALAKMRTEGGAHEREVKRKPERLYLEGHPEPILLDEGDLVTRFLARIRDEVHRFVITFHREKRARRVFSTRLDTVAGVTPERRQRLLRHFKTVAAIAEAPIDEVAKIARMPRSIAVKIHQALSNQEE